MGSQQVIWAVFSSLEFTKMCIEIAGYCAGSHVLYIPSGSIIRLWQLWLQHQAAARASLEILAEREQNRVSEGKDGGGGATGKTDQELQHYSF